MRKNFCLFIFLLFLAACGKQSKRVSFPTDRMTVDLRLPTTPVKDQGNSSLCWAYAMLATIETEHIMQGDSVNLSPDYVARMYLSEQVMNRHLLPHRAAKESQPVTTRGMSTMLIDLIETYGLQHYDAYHRNRDADYKVLCRKLSRLSMPSVSRMIWGKNANITKNGSSPADNLLDESLGGLPRQVFMFGAIYTPLEFAHSVCRDDEYTALTSFTHHPYNQRFPLEVPDNYFHNTFLNVPLDTMMNTIVRSLHAGHPVCWEGDISEPGFSFSQGIAVLQNEDKPVTTEHRQASFESHRTTDDHCMEIIGLAHDRHGRRFFLCKNSWGTDNPYHGFMFLSENYVRLKTIAIVSHN
ncbi:MAG: cysteine protease [Prevotella sp.]|nr:cysteine protease [Prevotella sp.]